MKESKLTLGFTERLLTALSLLFLMVLLAASGWLWRWDQLFYDLQVDFWSQAPADDVVIVAVDERSLSDFGRWPWPRGIHAQLIDILTKAEAKAIAMDILFAEPDLHNIEGDRQLIQATAASGKVFFPVVVEEYRLGGQLIESMPMPQLAAVAAGLGHMHMELDADGIARGIFLYEGLGGAYWPHMMISLLNWLDPQEWPLARQSRQTSQDTQTISRRDFHLIPFTGPPGHYPRYSYSQVLKGEFMPDAFKDRIVLVGVTATGLGDVLPTPVSAEARPMPGVEINANILDVLRDRATIARVGEAGYLFWTALLVVLPFLLYPYFPTRLVPVVTVTLMLLLLSISLVLLHGFHIWFPPVVAMLGLFVSYPLWSWRRLDLTVTYLRMELENLHAQQQALPAMQAAGDLRSALDFLQRLLPLRGWCVYAGNQRLMEQEGESLGAPVADVTEGKWQRQGAELWTEIHYAGETCQLGLLWPRTEVPEGRGMLLLEDFARRFGSAREMESTSTLEQVERRIQQVRQANDSLSQLRGFIDAALGQMDDGLLVVNALGRVVLANPRSVSYLGRGRGLEGEEALSLLQALDIRSEHDWNEIMRRLFLEGQPIRFEAKGPTGRELYLQLQPLEAMAVGMHGVIINLSDIGALKQTERIRTEMIGFLSHDIRSPITSLLSLTQSRQASEGNAKALAKKIRPLALRSLKMADDFLQLARAEAADEASFTDTEFVSVIDNAMDEVYAQAQLRGIRLTQELEVEEVWLQGNLALLERALLNLLGNAIKFSPNGGEVKVRLVRNEESLECCVMDQGSGIPAEQHETIFLPYRSAEPQGRERKNSVGLGLSFVKVVAEKHQGAIRIGESPDGGASFCLRLPCEPREL